MKPSSRQSQQKIITSIVALLIVIPTGFLLGEKTRQFLHIYRAQVHVTHAVSQRSLSCLVSPLRPFCHMLSGEWSLRTVESSIPLLDPFKNGWHNCINSQNRCWWVNILHPLYIPFWSTLLTLGFYFEKGATWISWFSLEPSVSIWFSCMPSSIHLRYGWICMLRSTSRFHLPSNSKLPCYWSGLCNERFWISKLMTAYLLERKKPTGYYQFH